MRIAKVKVYTFEELSEDVQEKVVNQHREDSCLHDWWDYIYDDAKNVGLEITGFDLYQKTIKIEYVDCTIAAADFTIEKILENHGKDCQTYKIALEYKDLFHTACESIEDDEQWQSEDERIETNFLKALAGAYLKMLAQEYDDINSDEYIIENIKANDNEFLLTGKIFIDK